MKTVFLATGSEQFESSLLERLNKLPERYVLAGSCVHKDSLLQVVNDKKPNLLIVLDSLPGKSDILETLKSIKNTVSDIRIIVLTRERPVGDAFLAALTTYGIYDFISASELNISQLVDLVQFPHSYSDIEKYLPNIKVDQTENKMAFESKVIKEYVTKGGEELGDVNKTEKKNRQGSIFNNSLKVSDSVQDGELDDIVGLSGKGSDLGDIIATGSTTLKQGGKINIGPLGKFGSFSTKNKPKREPEPAPIHKPVQQPTPQPITKPTPVVKPKPEAQPAKPTVKPEPVVSKNEQTEQKSFFEPAYKKLEEDGEESIVRREIPEVLQPVPERPRPSAYEEREQLARGEFNKRDLILERKKRKGMTSEQIREEREIYRKKAEILKKIRAEEREELARRKEQAMSSEELGDRKEKVKEDYQEEAKKVAEVKEDIVAETPKENNVRVTLQEVQEEKKAIYQEPLVKKNEATETEEPKNDASKEEALEKFELGQTVVFLRHVITSHQTCLNTAFAFAERGKNILIVDSNKHSSLEPFAKEEIHKNITYIHTDRKASANIIKANKMNYDMIFVDAAVGNKLEGIMEEADSIILCIQQDPYHLEQFKEKYSELIKDEKCLIAVEGFVEGGLHLAYIKEYLGQEIAVGITQDASSLFAEYTKKECVLSGTNIKAHEAYEKLINSLV